jgi:hypothetical protein
LRISEERCQVDLVVIKMYPATGPSGPGQTPRLPVFGEGGLLPGVDLDNSAALLDAMDARGAAPRR